MKNEYSKEALEAIKINGRQRFVFTTAPVSNLIMLRSYQFNNGRQDWYYVTSLHKTMQQAVMAATKIMKAGD